MTTITERLNEWREKANAATEGPWHMDGPSYHFYGDGDGDFVNSSVVTAGTERQAVATMAAPLIGDVIAWGESARRFEKDAEFIAASREAVPRLLDAVEKVLALADNSELYIAGGHRGVRSRDIRAALAEVLEVDDAE